MGLSQDNPITKGFRMADVSIVIPIAPYHEDIAQRAIDSAKAQTAPCIVLPFVDKDARGAGWARNQVLAKVNTHFVIFLDADDWIEPQFAERCLGRIRPNSYVYTDWYQDGVPREATQTPWDKNGSWHVITTLLETAVVKRAGGFIEQLSGAEDTFFYWHITRHGVCGIHLPEPLFHYGKEGRRARAFVNSPEYLPTMRMLEQRYENMSCCGDPKPSPTDSGLPGDVLARAMWAGNMRKIGVVSGRLYPRTGNFKVEMVDPRDVQAAPHEWQTVQPEPELAPPAPFPIQTVAPTGKVYELNELAQKIFAPDAPAVLTADQLINTLPANVRPDVSRIKALAGNNAVKDVPVKILETHEKVEKPKRGRKAKATN